MTFKVTHLLQAFSNAIFRTVVQHLTRFQLTLHRVLCELLLYLVRCYFALVVITIFEENLLDSLLVNGFESNRIKKLTHRHELNRIKTVFAELCSSNSKAVCWLVRVGICQHSALYCIGCYYGRPME